MSQVHINFYEIFCFFSQTKKMYFFKIKESLMRQSSYLIWKIQIFSSTSVDSNENYLFLTNSFSKIVAKHAPFRSSHRRCFVKKSVLRNFAKFAGVFLGILRNFKEHLFNRTRLDNCFCPLKQTLRGNHAPFVSRELRKAIYTRSRFRNLLQIFYLKNPDEINSYLYKQQQNKCVSIRRKSIKNYCSNITSNGIITNKIFWKAIKILIAWKILISC